MALTETLDLDIRAAQAQLSRLNAQLDQLAQPVNIPVNISGDQAADSLRRDLGQADDAVASLNSELRETDRELDQVRGSARGASDAVLRVGTGGASAFSNLRGSIVGVAAALAAIQGARLLGSFAFDAIQSASNLEESLSKTNVVFGQLSSGIQKFAATAPQALGLSTAAALEATSTFGNLFVALGLSQQAAADLSPDIVQLAADLASFNNIDVTEATEKLRSGLVGEVEPLRSLGVSLSAALVEAKALSLGFVDVNGAVTEAGKVQARYALILEQTTTAQGDYARTADGIANTQRTLAAEFENAKTAIGNALLPAYQSLLGIAPQLVAALEDLAPSIRAVSLAFAEGVGDSEGFLTGLAEGARTIPTTISGLTALGGALTDAVSGIRDIASLDFENASLQAEQLASKLGGLIEQLQVSSLTGGFIDQLQAGVDPAKALANALVELNNTVSNPADLLAATEAFARISGLDASRLEDVVATIRSSQQALGLTNVEVSTLIAGLREINLIPFGPNRPGSRGGERETNREIAASALERAAALTTAAREEAAALRLTGAAVTEADTAMSQFDVTNVVNQIQSLAQGFTEVGPEIQNLPDLLSDARTALQAEQGGIVEDFDEFFKNLQTALAARQEFQGNLLILRAMGLDDLADTFETLGLDSAQALADAITDPSKAAEAERILEAQARDQASAFSSAFAAELAGMIAVLPVEVQLQQIQIPELQAALNITPFGGGQGVGDVIAGTGTVINNNFYDTPQPTTDTVRITQSLQQIRQ